MKDSAAFRIESVDVKSNGIQVISTSFDTDNLISLIASVALDSVRAPRKIFSGLCLASWRIVSLPRPAFPMDSFRRRFFFNSPRTPEG